MTDQDELVRPQSATEQEEPAIRRLTRIPRMPEHNWVPDIVAGALTATVALHMLVVVFGNLTDFGTNREFVQHVLAMDTTFRDPDLMWRAVTSRPLQDAAYVLIIAWETVAAALLVTACVQWVRGARRYRGVAPAQRLSSVGLLMVLLLFGAGFMTVGGEWFAMWQSEDWNGLDSALRIVVLAGLALLTVHRSSAAQRPGTP